MKKLIIALLLYFICAGILEARYSSLDDALKNGISRGNAIVYGNFEDSQYDKSFMQSKFGSANILSSQNKYIIGSVGLGYTTGFYYNLRGAISFRAFAFFTPQVKSAPYYDNNIIALDESFVEYFDGDTAIKAGRFLPISPFINNLVDGVWIRNASINALELEALWANDFGRVSYYEVTNFNRLGQYGYYSFGAKYYLTKIRNDYKNSAYINVYSFLVPDVFTTFGARWHSAFRFNNGPIWIGLDSGIGYSSENQYSTKSYKKDTFLADVKLGFGFRYFDVFVGFVGSGDSGIGSFNALGIGNSMMQGYNGTYNNILPFFSWGGMAFKTSSKANLIYASAQCRFFDDKLNLYFTYASTFYSALSVRAQNEINFMLDSSITNNISVIVMLTNTHIHSIGMPNYTRINGGIRLSF